MSHQLSPLSAEARAAGHRLYQELYGPVSEGITLSVEQAMEAIARLSSDDVPDSELIRAAMAEGDFFGNDASDEESAHTQEDWTPESSARMTANREVVSLLWDAQTQIGEDRWKHQSDQMALWGAQMQRWAAQLAPPT